MCTKLLSLFHLPYLMYDRQGYLNTIKYSNILVGYQDWSIHLFMHSRGYMTNCLLSHFRMVKLTRGDAFWYCKYQLSIICVQ